jgi:hypothetical protein
MSPEPKAAPGYLPTSAYFASGAGGACSLIDRDCNNAGFWNVTGPTDSQKATELWITPPGGRKTQLSPPGTAPHEAYDLDSLITLVGTPPQRPV